MLDVHAAAIRAALVADPNLTVYDGSPPDGSTPPYVVMWVSLDNERGSRLCMDSDMSLLRVTTHSLGVDGRAARVVASNVRRTLLDMRLSVTGWTCWPIRHEYGLPPQADHSTGSTWVDAIDGWTYMSTPA